MMVDKDAVVAALRLRYDYFSAESVFEIVRQRAGLENKAALDAAELRAFRAALVAHGDRTDRVLAQVDELLGGAPPAAKPTEATKPAPPSEPAKHAKGTKAAKAEPEAAAVKPAEAATPEADPAAAIETMISLKGLEVAEGERVLICGGSDELGDWDPEKARPLVHEGERWSTTLKLAPETEVSFKFLRRDSDGTIVWEAGDSRSITAAQPLDATWR